VPTPPLAFASADSLSEDELRAPGGPHLPRPSRLAEPLSVSPAPAAKGAERLGLHTVGDLLEHLPRDRSEARTIAELGAEETATVVVEVRSITSRPVRRRGMKPLVEATVADATGIMKATFFNQPWLERKYRPGTRLMLQGKYQGRNRFRVQFHAQTGEATGTDTEVATYPATEGLSTTQIAALVREHRGALADVVEPLPSRMRAAGHWPDRAAALHDAHFGGQEGGRVRLAFEELLVLQLALLRRRAQRREGARAEALDAPGTLTRRWLAESLPFTPTDDQRAAMAAVDRDLAEGKPMQRLLMGEVGSGKTVVALYAMLRAVEQGAQAALMAPTETLAEQHFATLQTLMPGELLQAALLTGSTSAGRRADLLGKLASGELKLLVGTHALIESAVAFDRLAVVVVDEQHRFGVNQRRALDRKAPGGVAPHVLHMTATPIPRTLALTAYGDLDVTVLRELPAGRRPIETFVASSERERSRAYDRIRDELRGRSVRVRLGALGEECVPMQSRRGRAVC
jgi:ATP-dependent DNA helicase RecG